MGEIKKQILLRRASINAPVGAGQEHASIRMHCLFGARPSTSSPVEPMGSDIHPRIHTQSFTYPPPGLGLNRPAFLTTFTQWSECTKPSGEIQSVCETERHKCRFGCASCKQNKERPFTFFWPVWNAWHDLDESFSHFTWPTSHCEPLLLLVVGVFP